MISDQTLLYSQYAEYGVISYKQVVLRLVSYSVSYSGSRWCTSLPRRLFLWRRSQGGAQTQGPHVERRSGQKVQIIYTIKLGATAETRPRCCCMMWLAPQAVKTQSPARHRGEGAQGVRRVAHDLCASRRHDPHYHTSCITYRTHGHVCRRTVAPHLANTAKQ